MVYNLIEIVKKFIYLVDEVECVYLFGSILNSKKKANDIDILLIYSKYTTTMQKDIKDFKKTVENASGMPVDLTILSIEEEKEVSFLKRINFLQLK